MKCCLLFLCLIQSPPSLALFGIRWLPRNRDQLSLLALFVGCSCLGFDIQLPHSHQLTDTPCGVCLAVPIIAGCELSGSTGFGPPIAMKMSCDRWGNSWRCCLCTLSSAHEIGSVMYWGELTHELTPKYFLIGLLSWRLHSNQINLPVGQWGEAVNLKSWRLMETCPHAVYNF